MRDFNNIELFVEKMPLALNEVYNMALDFYRSKVGKIVSVAYSDNIKLIALAKQVAHGPFNDSKTPQLGPFDFVGKDRVIAWRQLGIMSRLESMEAFIAHLENICPSFSLHIEAVKRNMYQNYHIFHQEKSQKFKGEVSMEREQKRHLQDVLNVQTFEEFMVYSQKQFPGNPEQQAVLIRQLQNEHYHQYMQRIRSEISITDLIGSKSNVPLKQEAVEDCCFSNNFNNLPFSMADSAKMWTVGNIQTFKEDVLRGNGDGVLILGHGEIITVQIPTNEFARCLFWEFTTDDYDVGFGLYFEWCQPTSNDVTIHISESDDDEHNDEFYEG